MTDLFYEILIGLGLIFTGLYFGVVKSWDEKNGTGYTVLGICICVIGFGFIAINALYETNAAGKIESDNQKQIESMSCSQLHDGLLHNTINGTLHDIQRATERYVAGCETK